MSRMMYLALFFATILWSNNSLAQTIQGNAPEQAHSFVTMDGNENLVSKQILEAEARRQEFVAFTPFTYLREASDVSRNLLEGSILRLENRVISEILAQKPDLIELQIPMNDRSSVNLKMKRADVFAEGFAVFTSDSPDKPVTIPTALYYRGMVNGDPNSTVAISIFEDQIIGLYTWNGENTTIHPHDLSRGEHLIFEDKDALLDMPFTCSTDELEDISRERRDEEGGSRALTDCVRVYIECDNALYVNKGSNVTNTVNWITAVFNNMATLYQNEQINTSISEVFVWTTLDNYSRTSATTALTQFRTARPTFNGDLAHLAALGGNNLGGVAWLDAMCTTYKYAYSNISSTYQNVPTYSWTVMVMTHEMGHNLGSNHTQWCGWTGGAIDNCYTTEGGCAPGPAPTNGGTIMSYCHLTSNGINLNNGFGPQPGNRIRQRVSAVTCLSANCTGTTTCNVPTGLAASNVLQTSATVSWAAASGAVTYNLQYKLNSSTTWSTFNTASTTVNLTGLTAATTYNVRVQTVCSSASSAYSTVVNFTTQSGTATCTTPSGLAASNIAQTTATVSWNSVSGAASYTLEYKLASATTWQSTTVSGTSVSFSGMTANTSYNARVQTNCSGSSSGFSSAITFTTLPASTSYCASAGQSTQYEWLRTVKLGSINRNSNSDGGYFDATNLSTNLNRGTSYTLTHRVGISGGSHSVYRRAWIDYNGNGSFDDAGEMILSEVTTSTSNRNRSFTVPTSSVLGPKRMRVAVKFGSYPTSCEVFQYGEVEDYTVNITGTGGLPASDGLVADLKLTGEITLYPNPTNDFFSLAFELSEESEFDVKVLDLLGRVCLSQRFKYEAGLVEATLDISGLNGGQYFVIIQAGNEVYQKKLIKMAP